MLNPMLGDALVRKERVQVEVKLTDLTTYVGNMFLMNSQRLQDMLNGDRLFIPLTAEVGGSQEYILINKKCIISIKELS